MSVGLVWMILILLGVVALSAWFVKALFPSTSAAERDRADPETPVEIARRRYEAGEITSELDEETVRSAS
jgi:uncharacterized membrane protein